MKYLLIPIVVVVLTACSDRMEYTPVDSDLLAASTCANRGGVESLAAFGKEEYLILTKLRIVCKDGSKWSEEYSETRIDRIKEEFALREQNSQLKRELESAKREVAQCSDSSDDK